MDFIFTRFAAIGTISILLSSCGDSSDPAVTISRSDSGKVYEWDGVDPEKLVLGTNKFFRDLSPGDALTVEVDFADPTLADFESKILVTGPGEATFTDSDPGDPYSGSPSMASSSGSVGDLVASHFWAKIYSRHAPEDMPDLTWEIDGNTARPILGEQGGAHQPTTASDSKSEGSENPKPESKLRPRAGVRGLRRNSNHSAFSSASISNRFFTRISEEFSSNRDVPSHVS